MLMYSFWNCFTKLW